MLAGLGASRHPWGASRHPMPKPSVQLACCTREIPVATASNDRKFRKTNANTVHTTAICTWTGIERHVICKYLTCLGNFFVLSLLVRTLVTVQNDSSRSQHCSKSITIVSAAQLYYMVLRFIWRLIRPLAIPVATCT